MTVSSYSLHVCLFYLFFSFLDALFGVQYDSYFVTENDGSVTLCAELLEGCLERKVTVKYETFDGTAKSRFHSY